MLRLSQQLTSIRKIKWGQSYLIFRWYSSFLVLFFTVYVPNFTLAFHLFAFILDTFWIFILDMGRLFKEPAMETVKTDLGSHGCNQALMKMRSLVMSRQTDLMAHKQRSATVHWFAVLLNLIEEEFSRETN